MLTEVPAMSNAERQRRFQLRNPGYDARRKAKERARVAASMERLRLAQQQAAAVAPAAVAAPSRPLMLPAPGESVFAGWTVQAIRPREAVLVER